MGQSEARTARPRGRPPSITTERVLAIARDVFLDKGIRATAADVAVRAGISEGAVFHRFGTKDALFRAAMKFDPNVEPTILASLPRLAGKGELRDNLVAIGLGLLELGSVALPVMMMAWSNPASEFSFERLAERRDPRMHRGIDAMRGYFAAEQKKGRIAARADADMLARVFIGSLHHRCLHEMFFADAEQTVPGWPTRETFVQGLVDLLLDGAGARRVRDSKGLR